MKRAFLYGSIIALIGWIVFWGIIHGLDPVPEKINDNVRAAFDATCKIVVGTRKDNTTSTGILLDTGYILTVAHGIDFNSNKKIDKIERKILVEFFTPYNIKVPGEIVCFNRNSFIDYAVIKVDTNKTSQVYATNAPLYIGDKVFTIGMTRGLTPLITEGYESWKAGEFNRTSCTVHSGNSGGGVFNKNQELRGVINRARTTTNFGPVRVETIIPMKGGPPLKIVAYGDAIFNDHIAGWSEYVNINTIRRDLKIKRLGFLIDKEPNQTFINWTLTTMLLQILGVLCCVWTFRRDLFGSDVREVRRNNARRRKSVLLRRFS